MHYLMSFVLGFFFCLLFYPSKGNSETLSNEIRGRTLSEQIAVINGQNPRSKKDHGVRITNGQTGYVRTQSGSGSAFENNERRICEAAYPEDALGVTLCMDNARRVRSDQYDRWLGIGRHSRN